MKRAFTYSVMSSQIPGMCWVMLFSEFSLRAKTVLTRNLNWLSVWNWGSGLAPPEVFFPDPVIASNYSSTLSDRWKKNPLAPRIGLLLRSRRKFTCCYIFVFKTKKKVLFSIRLKRKYMFCFLSCWAWHAIEYCMFSGSILRMKRPQKLIHFLEYLIPYL